MHFDGFFFGFFFLFGATLGILVCRLGKFDNFLLY
jgi:hypothetical protein